MKTSDRLLNPERGLFYDKSPERPPLEWFVFVINEMCPRAIIWGKAYRGKSMLYVAARKHGYSKFEIDGFINDQNFNQEGLGVRGNTSDVIAEENCMAILLNGA